MSSEDRVPHQESSNKTIRTSIPQNQRNRDKCPYNGSELCVHPSRSGGQPDHLSPLPCTDSKRSTRRQNPKDHGFFSFQHVTTEYPQDRQTVRQHGDVSLEYHIRFFGVYRILFLSYLLTFSLVVYQCHNPTQTLQSCFSSCLSICTL